MMKRVLAGALCLLLLFIGAGTIAARVVYVNEDYVELRADKGGWSDPVATLNKGAALEVLEGEGDDETSYYRVRVMAGDEEGVEGYVFKDLVADQQPDEDDWDQMAGYFGDTEASAEGDVAAAKGGFGDRYAQNYGYNLEPVFAMDEIRKQIRREDMQAFMREGGVGTYQPRRRRGGGR